ncbi:hypothetical protein Zmor_018556 [Zophobas morio]|uniref:ABC transporter domain-containing protein n=1 Tax=Zophobas morio TaxID=2755281 RepID=A0AA38IAE7_9CUCU|nr:hypothetical protein Zmor_018556 [Zophobas morio]
MWRKLTAIVSKNLIIRKRHWILTLCEVVVPIILFVVVAFARSKVNGMNKIHIEEPTFYEPMDTYDIYSHLDAGEINFWYAPGTNFTRTIINGIQSKIRIPGDRVKEFASNNELLLEFDGKNATTMIAAINFNVTDPHHLNYDLTLYTKYFKWDTDKLFIPEFSSEKERVNHYIYKGFAALQIAIDTSFLELHLYNQGAEHKTIDFSLQRFPDPPRTIDSGVNKLFVYFLPIITIVSFMCLFPSVLQRVGEEKFLGTKEYMKMTGLNSSLIWLGWFIHALMTTIFTIIIIVVLMKVPLWGVSYSLIEHSECTVLFTLLFLYCMATITFCFLIACIIDTPSIATIVGMLFWILSYFIPQSFLSFHEVLQWKYKIPFAIFPNMALYYGYSSIFLYEMTEVGIQWSNIFQPGSGADNDVTMGNVFIMLICDIVLFMTLTLYIENVKPGQYGISKSYYFPLTSFVTFVKKSIGQLKRGNRVQNASTGKLLQDFEKGSTQTPCIQIINLQKKYSHCVVVDDLTMDIYKNRITVLLGENGAGKTTTMSILTGMINATNGVVLINDKNIQTHSDDVRHLMGLCPQHNLLFPDLTVEEHLRFFAKLKGSNDGNEDVKNMLLELGIYEQANTMVNSLSGGMKRKLCLGMALIGNPEILILDEPTSGMDPESRRKIWNLLLEYRKTKTILITTHFMEEADVLGDRIAIMADGRLQCYDTPSNLKTKYNTGYRLNLLLDSNADKSEIEKTVKAHFPDVRKIRQSEDSVVYLLPLKQEEFAGGISALEKNQNTLGIQSISMDLTTINDVFLKVGTNQDGIDGEIKREIETLSENAWQANLHGRLRSVNQLLALIKKRYYFLKKKYLNVIPLFFVSICIFLLAIWLSNSDSYDGGGPSINYSLQVYGKPKVYYGGEKSSDPVINNLRDHYKKFITDENGEAVYSENISDDIIKEGVKNIAFYMKHMIAAVEFNRTSDGRVVIVNAMYSSESLHGVPISINLATNAIAKAWLGSDFSINTHNTPLKPLRSQDAPFELSEENVASVWLTLIPISILFLMCNFIVFPYTEVSTHFMQIQITAGIRTYFYWLTNVVFDVVFSLVPMMMLFSILLLVNQLVYNWRAFNAADIWAMFVICETYIIAALPFTYLFSFRKTTTGAFALLLMLGMFFGIVPSLITAAVEYWKQEYYIKIANCLKPVLIAINPQFALSYISFKFAKKYVENFNWKYMDPNKRDYICNTNPNPCCNGETTECRTYQNYFRNKQLGIGEDLALMFVAFGLYFALLIFINSEPYKKIVHALKYLHLPSIKIFNYRHKKTEIEDFIEDASLQVKNLTKTFGDKIVVRDLQFYLKNNKCFGLLGVNGAGKSTTIRMLTKNLFFDGGSIILNSKKDGKPLRINQLQYSQEIGYCPQENCMNYYLTGRELIRVMAYLRGFENKRIEQITDSLLTSFGLNQYADQPCSEYSGGNKRKLNCCMAFLGSPKVICLDEPTSGVDPASRRKFWRILSLFKQLKLSSFLLCSHSMEECENLCDEIAIMKSGEINDQGSLLSLKNKYQKGFKIVVTLKSETSNSEEIKKHLSEKLKAHLKEEYANTLTYEVLQDNQRLSGLFSNLEKMKEIYKEQVVNYEVNAISLEDIFLTIAETKDEAKTSV